MKKNMFPLLGIAFVVAIVSTGVFYGLFAGKLRSSVPEGSGQIMVVATRNLARGTIVQADDVAAKEIHNQIAITGSYSKVDQVAGQRLLDGIQKGEPITDRSLAFRAAGRIPTGMRAISIRVSDSAGLAPSIKAGTKVDLQAFLGREGVVELRTILQDVEVLSVQPPGLENAPAIVTVLARPQDADQIALADSGAHIRVTLRNPEDSNVGPSRPVLLSSLFSGQGQPSGAINAAAMAPIPQSTAAVVTHAVIVQAPPVYLNVQVLGASPAAYKELEARLSDPRSAESLQVVPFQTGTDTVELIRSLAGRQDLEVVATQRLALDANRPAVWNAGSGGCQFRIQFQSSRASLQMPLGTALRVQPEWTWSRPGGTESRRFDVVIPDGRNFLVGGLFSGKADRAVLDTIFPGHAWATHDLIVLVSPDSAKSQIHAVASIARGR
jgi:Flp pilus assembly protein CpaB